MRGSKLINLEDEKYQAKLKDVSFDDTNKISMIESDERVIDFDAVKNDYIKSLKLTRTPKSNDALAQRNETFYFIEFKSGHVKKHDIAKKIYDSLLILMDIISQGITFTRENVEFILVYDYEKNKKAIEREIDRRSKGGRQLGKREIQLSTGITDFAKDLSSLAKTNYDPFYMAEDFKGLYLRDFKSYEVSEFEESFLN